MLLANFNERLRAYVRIVLSSHQRLSAERRGSATDNVNRDKNPPKHSQHSSLREVRGHLSHHLKELVEGQNTISIVISISELLFLNTTNKRMVRRGRRRQRDQLLFKTFHSSQ
jgi:hypothetical protein